MKCNYCDEIFNDDDSVMSHFYHLGENHYDVLTDEDRIIYDIRKKMIESKSKYESQKQTDGDSDLIFNSRNSEVQSYSSFPGPTTSSGFILLSQSPLIPLINEIIPATMNPNTNPKNTV